MKRSSNRSVATRLRALLLTAGLVLAGVVGVASPASANATVLLSGSGWLGGDGVNVCANTGASASDPSCGGETQTSGVTGAYWQCVELAQRLYAARGWHSAPFTSVGVAHDIYDNASTNGFTRQANGSITSVVPGDMLVFSGGGGPGHVGIINTITDNGNGTKTLAVVNQNAYEVTSNVTWNTSAKTVGKYWYMDDSSPETTFSVMGIVHDPDNDASGGGGSGLATHNELLWYDSSTTGVSALGMNATGSGFTKFWTQTGFGAPEWAGVGDMNGDGHDDLVWYDPNGTVNVETMNSAKNGFRLLFKQTGYGHPVWAGIGDINGDGKDDLLWYESNYTISAVTMNGSGTGFSLLFRATSFAVPTWAGVGDVNGDGHDDLLWYNNYTINAETMNGAGTGFNLMFQAPNFAVPTWAGLADLDGAGPDELLWYDSSTTGVSALGLNSAGTGFNKFWTQSGYGVPTWAGVGDVNGDGHDDLLWYDGSNYTISAVTMNAAKNGLAPMFQAPSFAVPTWAGLADLDGQ